MIERLIDRYDASEWGLAIRCDCLVPGSGQIFRAGHTAWVRMLEDGNRGALKLTDQVDGRRCVEDVVVAQFLALQLLEMV